MYDNTLSAKTHIQDLPETFCKAEQDCFEAETSLKIEDLRSNKTTDKISSEV
jgi:hypothetical protein